jgi:5-formyltetrahydrofolate cyclo-ligase
MTNRPEHWQDVADAQMSDKAQQRRRALLARRQLSAAEREAADAALVEQAVLAVTGRSRVAAYAPMPGEPGGASLLPALAAAVDQLLLPVLLPDADLDWAAYTGEEQVSPAGFRIPSGPRLGVDAIASAEIVLVPAVAVDPAGHRLGRGGGSYDRALARVSAGVPVLALLYPGELVGKVVTQSHDRPVTGVLLPGGAQSCGSPSAPG